MLAANLKLYPSWNVQKTPIPPRSRLYHLEPIGVGTPYVESLTGYVARLAQQHCVTTRRLILNEIAPYLRLHKNFSDHQTDNISHVLGIQTRRAALNGTGLMASKLLSALSILTQNTGVAFSYPFNLGESFSKQRLTSPPTYLVSKVLSRVA